MKFDIKTIALWVGLFGAIISPLAGYYGTIASIGSDSAVVKEKITSVGDKLEQIDLKLEKIDKIDVSQSVDIAELRIRIAELERRLSLLETAQK